MTPAIKIQDLTVAYNEAPVLWDIDLTLPQGELIAIVGPNGAGKTTLIKAILKLIKPTSGHIEILPEVSSSKKIHEKVAYVPQKNAVDWDFPTTAIDVVMMGRYGHLGLFKRVKKKERELALDYLKKVGMEDFANRQISQLSGGQQQRVFLARALIQEADIFLLDEPLKGVDATTEKILVELLRDLQQKGKTVIVVHHDLRTVTDYFDSVVLINKHLIANGKVADAFTEALIEKTYKGKIGNLTDEEGV